MGEKASTTEKTEENVVVEEKAQNTDCPPTEVVTSVEAVELEARTIDVTSQQKGISSEDIQTEEAKKEDSENEKNEDTAENKSVNTSDAPIEILSTAENGADSIDIASSNEIKSEESENKDVATLIIEPVTATLGEKVEATDDSSVDTLVQDASNVDNQAQETSATKTDSNAVKVVEEIQTQATEIPTAKNISNDTKEVVKNSSPENIPVDSKEIPETSETVTEAATEEISPKESIDDLASQNQDAANEVTPAKNIVVESVATEAKTEDISPEDEKNTETKSK